MKSKNRLESSDHVGLLRWSAALVSLANSFLLLKYKMPRKTKRIKAGGASTRSLQLNWFLGYMLDDLPNEQLPTIFDVVSYYQWQRESIFASQPTMSRDDRNTIFKWITEKLISIWHSASIYTIRKESDIRRKLSKEVAKLEEILRQHGKHSGDDS